MLMVVPLISFQYTLRLFDYPLWWVVCLHDYVLYTGDLGFLGSYYPHMVSTLDDYYPSHLDPSTGLMNKPSGYGDYAFVPREGPVTYFNALYVHALRAAALLARHHSANQMNSPRYIHPRAWNHTHSANQPDDAARWEHRAASISDALNARNFDNATGAFFDGTCGDTFCATHAQDGNSLAILSGVADRGRATSILSYWAGAAARDHGNAFYDNDLLGADYGDRTYAFVSYFEIAARFESGLVESALEEMRRLWGFMAAGDPGVTFWEGSGEAYNADPFRSRSHGWSTGVVPLLSRYVLGVTPTAPGFAAWSVKPHVGDLKWARGVVPTPGGQGISVRWEKSEGVFKMEIEVPEGLGEGTVAVPVGEKGTVRVNGEVVWGGGKRFGKRAAVAARDGYVEFRWTAGKMNVVVGEEGEL